MVAPELPHFPLISSSESQSEARSPKMKPSQPPNMTTTTVKSVMSIQIFLRRCRSGSGLHSSYLHRASRLPAAGDGPGPWRILPPGKISSLETCWARMPAAKARQLPRVRSSKFVHRTWPCQEQSLNPLRPGLERILLLNMRKET